ncbi:MAG: sulfatase [Gemmatimonadetes bacterium]|nr:sulfatase [Gemmatimonadota bacterium]
MPAAPPPPPPAPAPATGAVLLLAGATGLSLGLAEIGALWLRRLLVHRWMGVGPDALWMAPLAYATLFVLLAGLGLVLGRRVTSRERAAALALGGVVFVADWTELHIFHPSLHKAAILLLALGLARLVTGPALRARPAVVRRTAGVLAAVVATACVAVSAGHWVAARRAATRVDARPGAGAAAPNILLLVLDTVRGANLSLYGYGRPTAPVLTRLAERGVAFERAYSTAPWTLPSHVTLLTGRHPHAFRADWWQPYQGHVPSMAEMLAGAGYTTGGFVGNTINCALETGLGRGFDVYRDHAVSLGEAIEATSLGRLLSGNRILRRWLATEQLPARRHAADVNREVLTWVRAQGERPWFAFVNYFDAHQPYVPPPDLAGAFGPAPPPPSLVSRVWNGGRPWARTPAFDDDTARMIAAYDASIAGLDRAIGALLDSLPRGRPTVIVVTADHGEEFGEHGWFEHGLTLYPLALHVPLVIVAEDRAPAGVRVTETVSLRDVMATVLDLAAVSPPVAPRGRSLARYWQEGAEPGVALAELSWVPRAPPGSPAQLGDARALIIDDQEFILRGDSTAELLELAGTPAGRRSWGGDIRATDSADWYVQALRRIVPDSLWERPKPTGFTSGILAEVPASPPPPAPDEAPR